MKEDEGWEDDSIELVMESVEKGWKCQTKEEINATTAGEKTEKVK